MSTSSTRSNKVVRHAVQLGTQQDGLQVIAAGLQPERAVSSSTDCSM